MNRAYISYLDPFRGLAILLIMLMHIPTADWVHQVLINGTVFFVFIAGFLMAHLYDEKVSTGTFWLKKLRRIVLPYLVAVLPGLVYTLMNKYGEFNGAYVFRSVTTGVGHWSDAHWFIPLVVLLFALYPLWRILMKKRSVLAALAVILLVGSLFTFRSADNANPWLNLLHFGPLFMVGIAMGSHRKQLEHLGARNFWKVWAVSVAVALVCLWKSRSQSGLVMEEIWREGRWVVDYALAAKIAIIPAILLGIKWLIEMGWKFTPLTILAKFSFGLFFWHGYFIQLIVRVLPDWGIGSGYTILPLLVGRLGLVLLVLLPGLFLARKLIGPKSVMLTGY